MSPVTHFLAGWLVANLAPLERRERAWIAVAGIIPDADGLGLVAELATRNSAHPLLWWTEYHHILGHNLGFALVITMTAALAAKTSRGTVALLTALSFHLHLLGDLIGARGPDGDQWPIPYLLPFSSAWNWTWSGQWALNAWPNIVLTALMLALTLRLAWQRGYSPLEMFSRKAETAFISTLRHRFGQSA